MHPVTVETYNEWRKNFESETRQSTSTDVSQRLSGKQLFLQNRGIFDIEQSELDKGIRRRNIDNSDDLHVMEEDLFLDDDIDYDELEGLEYEGM